MSRFVLRCVCFVMLQLVVAAGVFHYGSPHDSNHYLLALQDKIARLNSCPGSRLVLVGGSNVAFGIHSRELQRATGMETINLGLHMSLGLPFPMECVREHGRSGDVVVLMPEYHLLTSQEQQGDPGTIHQLLEQWPQARRYFDPARYASWKSFLDRDALCQAHRWVKRAWYAINDGDGGDEIYRRSSFNPFGDLVAHYGVPSRSIRQNEPLPQVDAQRLDEAIELLNVFSRECKRRGISVYFSYPPLPESRFASSASVVHEVHQQLRSRLEIPLLDHPEDIVYPSDHFFDTAYHLNRIGGQLRTRTVAHALVARHPSFQSIMAVAATDAGDVSSDESPHRPGHQSLAHRQRPR